MTFALKYVSCNVYNACLSILEAVIHVRVYIYIYKIIYSLFYDQSGKTLTYNYSSMVQKSKFKVTEKSTSNACT